MDNSPEFQRIQMEGNADMVSNMMRVCREKTLKKSNKKMREEADEFSREMGQALASALNHIAKQALM